MEKVIEVEKIIPVEIIKEIVVEVNKPQPYEKERIIFNEIPQIV